MDGERMDKSSPGAQPVHTMLRAVLLTNPCLPDKSNSFKSPPFHGSIAGNVDAPEHPEGRSPRES